MRHFLTIFLLLLLSPASAKPNALPPPVVPQCFGVNAALTGGGDPKLDRLEAGGFGWVGLAFRWADIEKAKNVYDFTNADALLAGLTAHHLKPVFVLDGANGLYPPGPAASAAFARFATAAVQRYHGRTILWEIGPGVPAGQTARTLRAADPGATVIAAPPSDAMRAQFKQGLLADADAIALPAPPGDTTEDVSGYDGPRRLMQTYAPPGRETPIVSLAADDPKEEGDDHARAQGLVRRWLSDLTVGVRLSLCDDVTGAASITSLLAARTLTRTLNGYRFIKRVPLTAPADHLLLFAKGTDGYKVVAWTAKADHVILLPIAAPIVMTSMTGDSLPAASPGGRLSLTLTGAPVYLDVPGDAAVRQAGAWAATPQDAFYVAGRPLRLALTYRNPDSLPHRVRFVALLTTSDGVRTPLPAGEDIVGPHGTLTLGMQAPALAGATATVRVGLNLDGQRQPYPQDVGFAPLTPLDISVAPLSAEQVQVQIDDPGGLAFAGRLNALGPNSPISIPVSLRAGQTAATVSVTVRPDVVTAWRLRDSRGRLAATLPARRLSPYPLLTSVVHFLPGDGSAAAPGAPVLQSEAPGVQRVRYQFAPGSASWRIGEEQPTVLPGRPTGYGLWVYGDGGGAQTGMEFQDSAGQTFRVNGQRLAWTGWRFVTFPLLSGSTPVEYPVKITALLRLDARPDMRHAAGTLLWKGPTIIYDAGTGPHGV